jgi:DNA-binding NarL/FixJ family response regulator
MLVRELAKRRVMLIENDNDIRNAFKLIINNSSGFTIVGDFDNCEDAIKKIRKLRPGVILMDIGLEGMNGIDGTALIKQSYPAIEVVIVTIYEDSEFVFKALKAGASGYILKTSNYVQLITALEEVIKGGAPMSSQIARMIVSDFHISASSPLGKNETQVLKFLSVGKTYIQIAEELLISKETVKFHIRNIYRKL